VIPESLDDYYFMLNNGATLNSGYPCLGLLATNSFYIPDQIYSGLIDWQRNAYTWTESSPYNSLPDWNSTYSKLLLCNLIIEGMSDVELPQTDDERERFKSVIGQAHFFRAISYFGLAQVFAKPYDPNSDNQDLTIPIKITADVKEELKNSKVKDLYKLIVNDLKIAVDNLPMNSEYFTRPNKLAAWALFSTVYLNMSNFEDCKKYSDSVLMNYSYLIDYNDIEVIGTYPFNKKEENGEIIFYNTLYNFGSSRLIIDSNLIKKFSSNDLRRNIYFKYNANGQATFVGSYAGNSLLFGGLALDEIYLNRAEANARLGNLDNSVEDLNFLLAHRFLVGTYNQILSTVGKDSIIDKVIEEREKELVLRGRRWSDIRRLTKLGEFNHTEIRIVEGKEFFIEPRSYKYTFPIPQNAIDHTNLIQNEGWNQ